MRAIHSVVVVATLSAGTASAQAPAMVEPPEVTEGATMVTPTDTTPMPVVIEPPSWKLRLGADAAGGVFFPGPAVGGGLAVRAGAKRQRLSLLVELGGYAGVGGAVVSGNDDDHVASGGAFSYASLTPGLQYDFADTEDGGGGFVGLGVILGVGGATHSEDRVDGDDVVQRASRSAAFLPGVDARVGWRFGQAHCFTVSAGVKVLGTAVTTETVTVPAASTPTSRVETGPAVAVLPMVSLGYDFR